jgi:hypothetical protein
MCNRDHRFKAIVQQLPDDSGRREPARCAGCAYEHGFAAGLERLEHVEVDLASLPPGSPNGHRAQSPHMAWALGYLHGVMRSYVAA